MPEERKTAGLLPPPGPPAPADASEGSAATSEPSAELQAEIERLRRTVRDLQTKVTRDRDQIQLWREFQPKFTEFLVDLLDIADNFERAEEAAKGQSSMRSVAEGLTAVRKQMNTALERRDIHRFEPLGEEFHPALHQILDPPAKTRLQDR
jgi:molecular chaperone GrpE (heat shock protein)